MTSPPRVAEARFFRVQPALYPAAGRLADLAVGVRPGQFVALGGQRVAAQPRVRALRFAAVTVRGLAVVFQRT